MKQSLIFFSLVMAMLSLGCQGLKPQLNKESLDKEDLYIAQIDPRPEFLTLSATQLNIGDSIVVSTNGLTSGSPTDWIGLYRADTPPGTAYLDWVYSETCSKVPKAGMLDGNFPSGRCQFDNLKPGSYLFYLFANNGYELMASSAIFVVGNVPPPPPPPTLSVQILTDEETPGTVLVKFANIPNPSPADWIGLFRSDEPTDGRSYLDWKYANCTKYLSEGAVTSGACKFTGLNINRTYEFRMYSNNGYQEIVNSQPFTIGYQED